MNASPGDQAVGSGVDAVRLARIRDQGQTSNMTSKALRKELFQLSTAEKLEIVEELWDHIAAERENEPFPLTDAQRAELDRRMRELDEHPELARPWEEVRERLWTRNRG